MLHILNIKLGEKSDNWAGQSQTEGVKADFTDHNNMPE